jgi:molybdopterin/thiamine biosynthesis adenylyltransferase
VTEIRFSAEVFDQLQAHLRQPNHSDEEGALMLAHQAERNGGLILIVAELFKIPDQGFIHKSGGGLTIDPEFLAPVIKRARLDDMSIILAHSHPFSDRDVWFSSIDDAGERSLMPKLQERVPGRPHAAMVFGKRSLAARVWLANSNGSVDVEKVAVVGDRIKTHASTSSRSTLAPERFARQALAFTAAGQALFEQLCVGITGLGGIGSQVFHNLVHLGVRHFVLVDHDVVEESNLSRLIGATAEDARRGTPKVEVMKRAGSAISPSVEITAIVGNVYHAPVARQLTSCDVIFSCTDTMVSRMVLTRFPKQYFIPLIDVGVNVQIRDSRVHRIGGRIMVLGPNDPCLDCLGYLNHETLTEELGRLGVVPPTPYTSGIEEPVPAVVSYNTTLAGLAVSEFIRVVLPDFPAAPTRTFQVMDGVDGVVRRVELGSPRPCGICDETIGVGDAVDLPVLKVAV